jgi:hypothetical protein
MRRLAKCNDVSEQPVVWQNANTFQSHLQSTLLAKILQDIPLLLDSK